VKSWEKLDLSRSFAVAITILLLLGANTFAQEKTSEKLKTEKPNKMEALFIWKISDELKLSTTEEKKFSDFFHDLNQKKADLLKEQDEAINRLAKEAQKAQKDILKGYRRLIEDYNKMQLSEFDGVKKMLGDEKLAKYLQIKRDLTNKVKNLLSEKTDKKDSHLPPPKVIEE
jgi:hypothetical protein